MSNVRVLGNGKLKSLFGNVKFDYTKPVKNPTVCALPSIKIKPVPRVLGSDLLHAVTLHQRGPVPNKM